MQTLKERAEKLAEDLGFGHYSMATAIAMIRELAGSLNTRPAAPVEGLETVAEQYGHPHRFTGTIVWSFNETWMGTPYAQKRTLVTKPQAEAVIAAEREGKRFWQNEYTQKSKLLLQAEADNAALTARVKELDQCHEGLIDHCNQKTKQIEALETQLAAVKKALEPFAEAAQYYSDSINRQVADDAEPCGPSLLVKHLREARAALEATP